MYFPHSSGYFLHIEIRLNQKKTLTASIYLIVSISNNLLLKKKKLPSQLMFTMTYFKKNSNYKLETFYPTMPT